MRHPARCKPIRDKRQTDPRYWRCSRCGFYDIDKAGHFPDLIFRKCDVQTSWLLAWLPQPGNVLRFLIYHATAGAVSDIKVDLGTCGGCYNFQSQMNRWGWRGCWTRRREIMARIQEKAAEHGYRSDWRALPGRILLALAVLVFRQYFRERALAMKMAQDEAAKLR